MKRRPRGASFFAGSRRVLRQSASHFGPDGLPYGGHPVPTRYVRVRSPLLENFARNVCSTLGANNTPFDPPTMITVPRGHRVPTLRSRFQLRRPPCVSRFQARRGHGGGNSSHAGGHTYRDFSSAHCHAHRDSSHGPGHTCCLTEANPPCLIRACSFLQEGAAPPRQNVQEGIE